MPCSTILRDSTVVASKWAKVVAVEVGHVVGKQCSLRRVMGPSPEVIPLAGRPSRWLEWAGKPTVQR